MRRIVDDKTYYRKMNIIFQYDSSPVKRTMIINNTLYEI